ncbi:hypothetical protein EUA06_18790 [Nocardioides glacieisoli]|uniref:Uncharacterized protein n=1 Tax=Nocardioides glacieisoli TaxID=1168730 RepID=A0A4Q2RJD8_9ACTN|nr:DUF6174 domain-containing protein [Nocardioides glacieisoli]RYB88831.1 hypothetical protein EUA06_18790 [Nocardioides glacieisoli]
MTTMKHVLLAALLPLGLAATAAPAAAADPQPVQPFVPGINEEPDLSTAWQKWQAKGIDDYVITVRESCFCVRTQPVETVIRNDRTVRVTRGDRRLKASRGWSMDELYSLIRSARTEAERVDVEWTPRGVPSSIAIDPSTMVADEETYYTVTLSRL